MAEGLGGEVEAAEEPEEAFGGGVGFGGGEFGLNEGLQGGGVEGRGELAGAYFLRRMVLDWQSISAV